MPDTAFLEGEAPPDPETPEETQAKREQEQARAERAAQRKAEANKRAQKVARRGWRLEKEEAAADEKPAPPPQTKTS
jgi:hypothetical protein